MSVHYKFKSSVEFDTLPVDGVNISVADLKEAIVEHKRLGKGQPFDLQITNAETKEVYSDEKALIPKNSSLIVARVPMDPSHAKKPWEFGRDATALLLSNPTNLMNVRENCVAVKPPFILPVGAVELPFLYKFNPFVDLTEDAVEAKQVEQKMKEATDLTKFQGSEDDKINAMMAQSTMAYHPSNYVKLRSTAMSGPVPDDYRCYKCHQRGHWMNVCPLNNQDLRKCSGIPREFLREVSDPKAPGVMLTADGKFVISLIDVLVAEKELRDRRSPVTNRPPPPEELVCPLCRELLREAVIVPCCTKAYCDECIRNYLLESDTFCCPACNEENVGPDTLIPNRYLRMKCLKFDNDCYFVSHGSKENNLSRPQSPFVRVISPLFLSSPKISESSPSHGRSDKIHDADSDKENEKEGEVEGKDDKESVIVLEGRAETGKSHEEVVAHISEDEKGKKGKKKKFSEEGEEKKKGKKRSKKEKSVEGSSQLIKDVLEVSTKEKGRETHKSPGRKHEKHHREKRKSRRDERSRSRDVLPAEVGRVDHPRLLASTFDPRVPPPLQFPVTAAFVPSSGFYGQPHPGQMGQYSFPIGSTASTSVPIAAPRPIPQMGLISLGLPQLSAPLLSVPPPGMERGIGMQPYRELIDDPLAAFERHLKDQDRRREKDKRNREWSHRGRRSRSRSPGPHRYHRGVAVRSPRSRSPIRRSRSPIRRSRSPIRRSRSREHLSRSPHHPVPPNVQLSRSPNRKPRSPLRDMPPHHTSPPHAKGSPHIAISKSPKGSPLIQLAAPLKSEFENSRKSDYESPLIRSDRSLTLSRSPTPESKTMPLAAGGGLSHRPHILPHSAVDDYRAQRDSPNELTVRYDQPITSHFTVDTNFSGVHGNFPSHRGGRSYHSSGHSLEDRRHGGFYDDRRGGARGGHRDNFHVEERRGYEDRYEEKYRRRREEEVAPSTRGNSLSEGRKRYQDDGERRRMDDEKRKREGERRYESPRKILVDDLIMAKTREEEDKRREFERRDRRSDKDVGERRREKEIDRRGGEKETRRGTVVMREKDLDHYESSRAKVEKAHDLRDILKSRDKDASDQELVKVINSGKEKYQEGEKVSKEKDGEGNIDKKLKHDKKKKKDKRPKGDAKEGSDTENDERHKKKKKEKKNKKPKEGKETQEILPSATVVVASRNELAINESLEQRTPPMESESVDKVAMPELSRWERDDDLLDTPKALTFPAKEEEKISSEILKRAEDVIASKSLSGRVLMQKMEKSSLNEARQERSPSPDWGRPDSRQAKGAKGGSIQITISSKSESQIGRRKDVAGKERGISPVIDEKSHTSDGVRESKRAKVDENGGNHKLKETDTSMSKSVVGRDKRKFETESKKESMSHLDCHVDTSKSWQGMVEPGDNEMLCEPTLKSTMQAVISQSESCEQQAAISEVFESNQQTMKVVTVTPVLAEDTTNLLSPVDLYISNDKIETLTENKIPENDHASLLDALPTATSMDKPIYEKDVDVDILEMKVSVEDELEEGELDEIATVLERSVSIPEQIPESKLVTLQPAVVDLLNQESNSTEKKASKEHKKEKSRKKHKRKRSSSGSSDSDSSSSSSSEEERKRHRKKKRKRTHSDSSIGEAKPKHKKKKEKKRKKKKEKSRK